MTPAQPSMVAVAGPWCGLSPRPVLPAPCRGSWSLRSHAAAAR